MKINIKDYDKGDIIRFIRQSSGLTQKEFAKIMKKSKRTIEDYEASKQNYNIEFIKELAKEFNLTITIESNNK